MTAYYNEFNPEAAAWLRELIKRGHIAPGDVDDRSILDVRPDELTGYTQCHFFAGIGGWSHALRIAGWPDDRPVWTGSCPCQPFSPAGRKAGLADERHLWPAWFWLIRKRAPGVVFGEQVASRDGYDWLDAVRDDVEAEGYAVGAVDLCAAGVGAPHKRQRLYFVADADSQRHEGRGRCWQSAKPGEVERLARLCATGELDDPESIGRGLRNAQNIGPTDAQIDISANSGNSESDRPRRERSAAPVPGPTNGFWRDADWVRCRDGRWRAIEPGSQPLAHGVPARMGLLRGYGNAIVPQVAASFIGAYMGSHWPEPLAVTPPAMELLMQRCMEALR